MDDIKRALQQIYTAQRQVDEAPAAAANSDQEVQVKGTLNTRAFANLLGMDANKAMQLNAFVNKHKKNTVPSRNEIMAAADVFRALIDADPQTVNQAMAMLRKITAESIAVQVEENLRLTKEGLDECWTEMTPNGAPSSETMTMTISMPNKNISVTTDSAEELMNVLKLAGIEVSGKQDAAVEVGKEETTWTPPLESDEPIPVVVKNESFIDTMSETELEEVLKKSDPAGKWIKDFIDSDNPKFAGKSKKERMQMALGAYYAAQRESIEQVKEEEIDENAFNRAAAAAARAGEKEFEFPAGSGKMHPVKMNKGAAHQMGESEQTVEEDAQAEARRILGLAGLDESKFANSPAGTSMDEPMEFDNLPSEKGTGAGKPDYGTRQSNMGGENPMAVHTMDLEESFQKAMGEYREFVAEKLKSKK